MPQTLEPSATTLDYCRQARRIRALHRNNPAKTQQALKGLIAGRVPKTSIINLPPPRFDWSDSAILGHRTPQARLLADQVAMRLTNGLLSQSARKQILAQAGGMGIGRFEANLIIAAVGFWGRAGSIQ